MLGRLKERWGDQVTSGGSVDRSVVGARVFNDPEELAWLESQVHPLVQAEISDWFAGLAPEVDAAVVEVPLLFEGGMADRFDCTVAIVAGESTRRDRARARGHVGVEGREDRQLSQELKAEQADYVVDNDGTPEDLENRLRDLLQELAT